MKRRAFFLSAIILFLAIFTGVGIIIATDIPDEINIKAEAFGTYKKGPVKLNHKKHSADYKIACTECHHRYEGGKNIFKEGDPVQKCSGCHDAKKSEGNVKKLMLAYHNNCQGCHKDMKKEGKNTGPTNKCAECHEEK